MAVQEIIYRALLSENIEELVRLHRLCLPNDVLPNLDKETISRYYQQIFKLEESRKAKVFGAYCGSQLIGFCCLTAQPVSIISLIKMSTIRGLGLMLFSRPILFSKAVVQYLHVFPAPNLTCEIAYIGVVKQFQSKGIGTKLIEQCMSFAETAGYTHIQTKTLNQKLFRFYVRRYGATVLKSYSILGDKYQIIKWMI